MHKQIERPARHIEIPKLTIHSTWQGVPAGVKRVRNIAFKQGPAFPLLLDIYMPEAPKGPVPVILWICGGGWRGMSKEGVQQVSGWIAGQGFAVIGFEYRLSQQGIFPACIEDCKAAARWVRACGAEYGLDPNRVGVWGDSAGGHLASLLGVSAHVKELEKEGPNQQFSSAVKAVCAFYPPMDLTKMPQSDFLQQLIGGTLEDKRAAYELASPITHVTADSPPHLLVHGDQDAIVPFEQSVMMDAALRRAGVKCMLVKLTGVGHSGYHAYGPDEVKQQVLEFFERCL